MQKIDLIKSKYTLFININYFEQAPEMMDKYKVITVLCDVDEPKYLLAVHLKDWQNFIEEQRQNANTSNEQETKELTEACETVLKIDPFGGKYNGFKLIDICKANILWVYKAINEMHNKYIVDRLKIILKGAEDGKIDI